MSLTHIVIDIETLSTKPNAVILSVACVPFVLEEHTLFNDLLSKGIYIKFDASDQIKKYKRDVDKKTIDWWKTQPQEVFNAEVKPSKRDVDSLTGITTLSKFIGSIDGFNSKKSYVWSRGNNFDFPILQSLYEDLEIKLPYNTWTIRDIRTAIDILHGTDDGKYELKYGNNGFIAHNPLHDAAMDAARLNELFWIAVNGEPAF